MGLGEDVEVFTMVTAMAFTSWVACLVVLDILRVLLITMLHLIFITFNYLVVFPFLLLSYIHQCLLFVFEKLVEVFIFALAVPFTPASAIVVASSYANYLMTKLTGGLLVIEFYVLLYVGHTWWNRRTLLTSDQLGNNNNPEFVSNEQLVGRLPKENNSAVLSENATVYAHCDPVCVVCYAMQRTIVLLPCRHLSMCLNCARVILELTGQCPVCRRRAADVINVYM